MSHAHSEVARPLTSHPVKGLHGELRGALRVPGDKSISHRAMIFGLLSVGQTTVEGLLEGEDVLRTAEACKALGALITRRGEGKWSINGVGIGGLREAAHVLDFGNAGTGSRLMMGVAGGHDITTRFDGDACCANGRCGGFSIP